jgi:hypothetical protein
MNTIYIRYVLGLFALASLFWSCSERKDVPQVQCTEEYRTVSLKINGDSLTDFYTIREQTGEMIRYNNNGFSPYMNYYPVLEDSYQAVIANSSERFNFKGFIDEKLVVDEIYIIGADFCHIYKVEGKDEITLTK